MLDRARRAPQHDDRALHGLKSATSQFSMHGSTISHCLSVCLHVCKSVRKKMLGVVLASGKSCEVKKG